MMKHSGSLCVICSTLLGWGNPRKRILPLIKRWAATWQNQQSDCVPSKDSELMGSSGPSFLHAENEDSDQTGQTPRLLRVFAWRTLILLVLSCHGLDAGFRLTVVKDVFPSGTTVYISLLHFFWYRPMVNVYNFLSRKMPASKYMGTILFQLGIGNAKSLQPHFDCLVQFLLYKSHAKLNTCFLAHLSL